MVRNFEHLSGSRHLLSRIFSESVFASCSLLRFWTIQSLSMLSSFWTIGCWSILFWRGSRGFCFGVLASLGTRGSRGTGAFSR